MKTQLSIIILLFSANFLLAKEDDATKKAVNIKHRNIGWVTDSDDIASSCDKKCSNHNEKYTSEWNYNWVGQTTCACKVPDKKLNDKKDIKYRWLGMRKTAKDIKELCPKKCAKNEEFTGKWKSNALGTHCQCKIKNKKD